MTKDRDLKDLVRARSARTGESYQAARRNLVRDSTASASTPTEDERWDAVVERLGDKATRKLAVRELMAAAGLDTAARAAVRRGLHHDVPLVRIGCCVVLDHHLDAEAVPDLIANLEHDTAKVRQWAMHALACDRCKEGECRPGEDDVIPIVVNMLATDRSRRVRGAAASTLGQLVGRRPDVAVYLERARDNDPHPKVRMIAGWYSPGGRAHKRMVEEHELALRRAARAEARAQWERDHPKADRPSG